MKALCWHGKHDIRFENAPDPKIINARDAIIRVTSTAICGSDLHLYNGLNPTMEPGDVLGHEFMGIVEEVGKNVPNLKPGDRVVVPFNIACGGCYFCKGEQYSLCDNSNPNARMLEKLYGFSGAGLFGYSHAYGGYPGGQAEYVRVPFADVGPIVVESDLADEQVLFLSDILVTAYQAVEQAGVRPGDTVAVWGCGPIGVLSVLCAKLQGAEQIIAIDRFPMRLAKAQEVGAQTIHYEKQDVFERLLEVTSGRGPDICIDAVGMEAHGRSLDARFDEFMNVARIEQDRAHALREVMKCCRKGGVVSIPGVYSGYIDRVPFGAAFAKALTFRMGQTHSHRYMAPLLRKIEKGEIDPSFIITHRVALSEGAAAYKYFAEQKDDCLKVVMKP